MKLAALMIALAFFIACNSGEPTSPSGEPTKEVADTSQSSTANTDLKVAAYLVYEDGSLSNFDVLNNDTIALWNTIIGEGNAGKPSTSTKINLHGDLQDLHILIRNGEVKAIDSTISKPAKEINYVIKNTGCDEVYVRIRKKSKVLYNDTIPFQCGE